jgi:hypothetical protein
MSIFNAKIEERKYQRNLPLPAAATFSSVWVISAGTLPGKTINALVGSITCSSFDSAAASVSSACARCANRK